MHLDAKVILLPVIANCEWTESPRKIGWSYSGFQFPNHFLAEVWKVDLDSDSPPTYCVRCLDEDSEHADYTDFGPPRQMLTEVEANFAIREIMDLDERGKTRDYLDERPTR